MTAFRRLSAQNEKPRRILQKKDTPGAFGVWEERTDLIRRRKRLAVLSAFWALAYFSAVNVSRYGAVEPLSSSWWLYSMRASSFKAWLSRICL